MARDPSTQKLSEGSPFSVDGGSVEADSLSLNSREVFIQDSAPASPTDGDVWIDTS